MLERADGRVELFGPTFCKALYKRAKGKKHGAEIKREFASHYKPKNKSFGNNRAGSSPQGYAKKPSPRGSTHTQNTQRGAYNGNQSRGRGQKSKGFHKPKSGYVYIFRSSTSGIKKPEIPKLINPMTKLTFSIPCPSQVDILPQVVQLHLKMYDCPDQVGPSKIISPKLAKNNKRSMDL